MKGGRLGAIPGGRPIRSEAKASGAREMLSLRTNSREFVASQKSMISEDLQAFRRKSSCGARIYSPRPPKKIRSVIDITLSRKHLITARV